MTRKTRWVHIVEGSLAINKRHPMIDTKHMFVMMIITTSELFKIVHT